ncbi:MAG: hypothetical protein Q7S10_01970 [bacterium]|nr:hypothetical protein [bacterium]
MKRAMQMILHVSQLSDGVEMEKKMRIIRLFAGQMVLEPELDPKEVMRKILVGYGIECQFPDE